MLQLETYAVIDCFMDDLTYFNNRMEKYSLLQVWSESWPVIGWTGDLEQKKPHLIQQLLMAGSKYAECRNALKEPAGYAMQNWQGSTGGRKLWGHALLFIQLGRYSCRGPFALSHVHVHISAFRKPASSSRMNFKSPLIFDLDTRRCWR